jgi:hypothetical protein
MSRSALSAHPRFPLRLTATIAALVALSLAGSALAFGVAPDSPWLPVGMALAALIVSIFSAYKGELLEFSPQVLAGDVILPRSSRLAGDLKFLLPLQFTNTGHAEGVVEWIALRVTLDGQLDRSLVLSPVAEVDMQKFLQSRRRIDPENTVEPFSSFTLEAKKSVSKFVLFDFTERPRTETMRLRPGRYSFELFLKQNTLRLPMLARTFEHTVEQKHVDEFQNDVTVYLINYDITLPRVRREAAGVEWLPRQAPN